MPIAGRFRRVRGLVMYWVEGQAVCFVWQSAMRVPLSSTAASLLDHLSEWTAVEGLRDRVFPSSSLSKVQETVDLLAELQLIEFEDQPHESDWLSWSPEATFFHFATKNGKFPEDVTARDRELVEKAKHHPQPAPTKKVDGPRLDLPDIALTDRDLQQALLERRTWRHFSEAPVPLASLATILNLTFGVQRRGVVKDQGEIIVRTSPSGGSRHPIEAYVLAWNVDGLTPGAYHYDSDTRQLVDLRRPISAADIVPLIAHQTYFAQAAALVVMCPVFARSMWRYEQSRAYRTVMLDAGHLGQTFCLVATALNLAPFTTMAFSEAGLEGILGLDGIDECPIYIAGVGSRDESSNRPPGQWQREG